MAEQVNIPSWQLLSTRTDNCQVVSQVTNSSGECTTKLFGKDLHQLRELLNQERIAFAPNASRTVDKNSTSRITAAINQPLSTDSLLIVAPLSDQGGRSGESGARWAGELWFQMGDSSACPPTLPSSTITHTRAGQARGEHFWRASRPSWSLAPDRSCDRNREPTLRLLPPPRQLDSILPNTPLAQPWRFHDPLKLPRPWLVSHLNQATH